MKRKYIVATGYAGVYAATDIIKEHQKELRSIYRSSFVSQMLRDVKTQSDIWSGADSSPLKWMSNDDALTERSEVCEAYIMPDGYLGALYDLAQTRRCGMRIRMRDIPVMQSVIEICELYGLNPYRIGTFARLTITEDPDMLLDEMSEQESSMSACIGYLTQGRDKLIIDKTHPEYINKPTGRDGHA